MELSSIRRAFELLGHLSGTDEGVSFNELRRRFGDLSPGTLSRLLRVMREEDLVWKGDGNGPYRPGSAAFSLARSLLGERTPVEIVRRVLKVLSVSTRESAACFELEGEGMILLCKCEMEESFHYMDEGGRFEDLSADPFGAVLFDEKAMGFAAAGGGGSLLSSCLRQVALEGVACCERVVRTRVLRVVSPVFRGVGGPRFGSLGVTALWRDFSEGELDSLKRAVLSAASAASRDLA